MDKINLGGFQFTIAFSGGCFSGKTSAMEALKSVLEKEGYKVVIISEAMRETEVAKSGMSIDAIRQDANLYFKLQKEIIKKKVKQERDVPYNGEPDTIYLFDRAITDSLFYYEFYVDKSKLDNKEDYFRFHRLLLKRASFLLNQIDLLIEFKPLENCSVNDDKMRPAYLKEASYSEYTCIHRLNYTYRRKDNVHGFMSINLNNECNNNCIEQIIDKIKETCQAQGR